MDQLRVKIVICVLGLRSSVSSRRHIVSLRLAVRVSFGLTTPNWNRHDLDLSLQSTHIRA